MFSWRIRKKLIIGITVMAALLFTVLIPPQGPGIAGAQQEKKQGWLEGTVHTADGEAGWNKTRVSVLRNGAEVGYDRCALDLDGFYEIRDLKPGAYEIRVTHVKGWRPQRIFGVVIKPGVRSILNITLHEGKGVEEIGQPEVATQPVIIISEELTRLQGEIDALKNQ